MALAHIDGVALGEPMKASGDMQCLPAIVVHGVWQGLPQLAESCISMTAVVEGVTGNGAFKSNIRSQQVSTFKLQMAYQRRGHDRLSRGSITSSRPLQHFVHNEQWHEQCCKIEPAPAEPWLLARQACKQ